VVPTSAPYGLRPLRAPPPGIEARLGEADEHPAPIPVPLAPPPVEVEEEGPVFLRPHWAEQGQGHPHEEVPVGGRGEGRGRGRAAGGGGEPEPVEGRLDGLSEPLGPAGGKEGAEEVVAQPPLPKFLLPPAEPLPLPGEGLLVAAEVLLAGEDVARDPVRKLHRQGLPEEGADEGEEAVAHLGRRRAGE